MKVYMYYEKKCLYGYTNDKELKKEFEHQRNIKAFNKKVTNMSEEEYEKFKSSNYNLELSRIAYSDCNKYYYIVSNNKEENLVNQMIDEIVSDFDELISDVEKLNLKEKYITAFRLISNIFEYKMGEYGWAEAYYNINAMYLFTILFENTLKL